MGFWTNLAGSFMQRVVRAGYVMPRSSDPGLSLRDPALVTRFTAERLWETQPHLRTVVAFRARNVAQLGLHCYRRTGEGRERDRTSPLAQLLAFPNADMTSYELLFALIGDHDLYDTAYWTVLPDADRESGWELRRLPPSWVDPIKTTPWRNDAYQVQLGGRTVVVPADQMMLFPGYDPAGSKDGSATVLALRDTLVEQIESSGYRRQLWRNGGRASAVIERPADAPEWSAAAREAFRQDWYSLYTGSGPRAGGTPILEDGMTLRKIDFSAQEQQYVDSVKLSLQTVASAFHVEPAMVGMGDGATYSNMRAFRKMLYTETLGPLLAQVEARINGMLIPMLNMDPNEYYVEFNIQEKLQGDFEEQAGVLSTSTGRPWMTANEARGRMNLPKVPGGDQLVIPLNVLVGGQSSSRDSGSQNRVADPAEEDRPKWPQVPSKNQCPAVKSRPEQPVVDKHAEVLAQFFVRQGRAIQSAMARGGDWWDQDRWDWELAEDLLRLAVMTSADAAKAALEAVGLNPDDYQVDRTISFLAEASRRNAEHINQTTKDKLDALDDLADAGAVFEQASEVRAPEAAYVLAGFAAGFGTVESGRQTGGVSKTWVVNSGNPRPSHAAMDGETVPIDEDFSNAMKWPGAGSDVDEVAGCQCSVIINYGQ